MTGSLFSPFIFLKTPIPDSIRSPELELFFTALEGRDPAFIAQVRVNTKEYLSHILHRQEEIPYQCSDRERILIEYCQNTGTNISELMDDFDRETYTLIFYRLCFQIGKDLLQKVDDELARDILERINKM